jgi:hypothetical protein
MYKVQMKAHGVAVARICAIDMLQVKGRICNPNEGVILVLDDGTRQTWLVEAGMDVPEIGQFLIVDNKISYIVDSAKFSAMFDAVEE